MINSLWKDLHGVGAKGVTGRWDVQLAPRKSYNDAKVIWTGLIQKFQRGWILIGPGSSAGSEIAEIALTRGLDHWMIWSRDLPFKVLPTVTFVSTTEIRPAAWSHGGDFFAKCFEVGLRTGRMSRVRLSEGDRGPEQS